MKQGLPEKSFSVKKVILGRTSISNFVIMLWMIYLNYLSIYKQIGKRAHEHNYITRSRVGRRIFTIVKASDCLVWTTIGKDKRNERQAETDTAGHGQGCGQ